MRRCIYILVFLFVPFIVSCQQSGAEQSPSEDTRFKNYQLPDQFGDYWYAGVAELNSYKLKQARYGEIHQGSAVLIFVTEPFSKSKQVKLDNPNNSKDNQTVLKMNFTKKFSTGIYPYSMMLSSFVPVERNKYSFTPKVSMSSQEWCGHMFAQLNLQNDNYELSSFSYFEQEGDVTKSIKGAWLEDEIWNLIRLDYKSLPVGDIEIIPGLFYTRLLHKNLKPVKATASLADSESIYRYKLVYQRDNRTLTIEFEKQFPHKILGWTEEVKSFNGKMMTTTAEIDKTLLTDYWSKNSNADIYLRDSLNLK